MRTILVTHNREIQASRSAALNLMDDAVEARNQLETANQGLRSEVAERMRAQKALLALSSRQEAILAAVPDIIMEVNTHKVYTWANQAGLAFFGDDVIGKEAVCYFEGEQATYQWVQPLFDGHQDLAYVESWQRRKDGQKRLLAWCCRVLKDESGNVTGTLSSARDITEEKRAQQEIESLARFPAENPNPVLRVKRDGHIIYANEASLRLPTEWNLKPGKVAPKVLQDIIRAAGNTRQKQMVDVFGGEQVFSISVVAVPNNDYFNLYAIDITERARTEAALRMAYLQQKLLSDVLWVSLENTPLELKLAKILDLLLAVPELSLEGKGAIFLLEADTLVMKTQRNLSEATLTTCARVPLGKCLCGRAAVSGQIEFRDRLDELHDIRYDGIEPHGHYCVPIRSRDKTTGVVNLYVAHGHKRDERAEQFLTAVANALSGIIEHKRAEEALRQSEERFHRAVVDSPIPILLHAEDGTILQASNSWYEITGYTREELATIADWTERAYGEKKTLVQADIDRLYDLNHREAEGDYTIRTKRGDTRIWDFSSAPLGRLPDGRRLVISMAMDVTERRAAEREVRRLNAELEQRVHDRTAQLEAANKELEAFSYSVSHDLRAPLRAVDGFARILAEDHAERLNEEGLRVLNTIRGEARRMDQLINDVLAFSRASRCPMQTDQIDMTALAGAVFKECAAAAPGRELRLQMDTLAPAQGDPAMVRQLLANLIANAIKYTRPKPIAQIEISSRLEDGVIAYCVRDNGVGFDMKYVGKLFGIFQRLHTEDEFEGTGVGLALVQRIVHRHGGRTWAEGKVNQGAAFFFTLPGRKETA